MWLYIIPCIVVIFFAILFIVFIVNKNRFQSLKIKINEVEKDIDDLLNQKFEKLKEIGNLVKSKTEDNSFDELENLNIESCAKVDRNNLLAKYDNSIKEYRDFNKNIQFDEEELKIFDEYFNINTLCLATERYYNDNVVIYNKLVKKFPASLVAKIKRYREKDLFVNEKEEIFEILKK